jgi:hypothetical protein
MRDATIQGLTRARCNVAVITMIGGTTRGLGKYTALLAFRYAEPMGSVRPKFPTMDNLNGLSVSLGGNMPLLCPAQGFPVPSHRYDILNRSVK